MASLVLELKSTLRNRGLWLVVLLASLILLLPFFKQEGIASEFLAARDGTYMLAEGNLVTAENKIASLQKGKQNQRTAMQLTYYTKWQDAYQKLKVAAEDKDFLSILSAKREISQVELAALKDNVPLGISSKISLQNNLRYYDYLIARHITEVNYYNTTKIPAVNRISYALQNNKTIFFCLLLLGLVLAFLTVNQGKKGQLDLTNLTPTSKIKLLLKKFLVLSFTGVFLITVAFFLAFLVIALTQGIGALDYPLQNFSSTNESFYHFYDLVWGALRLFTLWSCFYTALCLVVLVLAKSSLLATLVTFTFPLLSQSSWLNQGFLRYFPSTYLYFGSVILQLQEDNGHYFFQDAEAGRRTLSFLTLNQTTILFALYIFALLMFASLIVKIKKRI